MSGWLSQIIGISNKNIKAEPRKMSLAAMVKACWSISRLMLAKPCAWLIPMLEKPLMAPVAAWLVRLTVSVNTAWCMAARSCHKVMVIEVPNEPPKMRMNVDKPEAEGIWAGAMPLSVSVDRGIKKNATAMP